MAEYWEWIRRMRVPHDVGFTLGQDSFLEALTWCLKEIVELEFQLEKQRSYNKELERTWK